jgi:NitT/TauT family transport system substrate-binding protein
MRLTWAGLRVPASRIILTALLAVLASGCSGLGGSAAGGEAVTVAVVPGVDNAPLGVATADGLFQQHGLRVTIKSYQSVGAELQALTGGQAQIAMGDYTAFLYLQATGKVSLRLISDGYDAAANSVAILTLPNSGITTPGQLQGPAGGVATPLAQVAPFKQTVPYNIQTLAAEQVLQSDGVSPSSVNWKQMQPGDMIGELRSGQVKAIVATEPYILEAEEQLGAVEVADASSGVTSGLPLSGYFSLNSYAQANLSTVQAFRQALDQAQTDSAQRGPVQEALTQLAGMTLSEAGQVTLGTYPASANLGQVQRVATLMYDSGMITSPVSVNALAVG